MQWITSRPDLVGYLPQMLNEDDPRPAREQFHTAYAHGGGWNSFKGFTFNPEKRTIKYPGDPPHRPVGHTQLRDETIIVYEHAWVLILQPDGTYEIARMD